MILSPEKLADIAARYETPDGDPPCTCTRKDVDFYDVSGCESCDPQSDYNKAHRHARYMRDLHGAQDIDALLRSHEELRADGNRKVAQTVIAILRAIDDLSASQKRELNGNPLTEGRYQGMRKCAEIVRRGLYVCAEDAARNQSEGAAE